MLSQLRLLSWGRVLPWLSLGHLPKYPLWVASTVSDSLGPGLHTEGKEEDAEAALLATFWALGWEKLWPSLSGPFGHQVGSVPDA